MKKIFPLLLLAVLFTVNTAFATGKDKKEKAIYAFGIGTSFSDTLVYFTSIQQLPGAKLDKKGFLEDRSLYSYELKDYMSKIGLMHRTCILFFNEDKSKLQKKLSKLQTQYLQKNKEIQLLDKSEFKFTDLEPDAVTE